MKMLPKTKKPGVEQCKDSGLALVLFCLVGFQIWKIPQLVLTAIVILLAAMTFPRVFRPFAIFWFALSESLGTVVSKIILTLLFVILVVPVGLVRRALGKDSMCLRCWKAGDESVFRSRNQKFTAKDLETPY